eukprot:c20370_g1_i2 orf=249-1088(+)
MKAETMSISENVSCPSTAGASSRKEKKKQAKEERDRLKQVEKKKRRLEKALATATAIRIELEKKKQRRKEEEQRLDEEGAALAEAVALQVLVEEEVISLDGSICGEAQQNVGCNVANFPILSRASKIISCDVKPQICSTSVACVTNSDVNADATGKVVSMNSISSCSYREQTEDVQVKRLVLSDWEISRDNLTFSSKRAKAAEVAAGLAAAQAVAALKIAEEARAEAEAAKKAAEAAICQVLDRRNAESDEQVRLFYVWFTHFDVNSLFLAQCLKDLSS